MAEPVDNFAWTLDLECPPNICSKSVKKILSTGLLGFLWDDIANATLPAKQATLVRKNILLQTLRQGTTDKVVQCMRSISELKQDKNKLSNEIYTLEEKYEQQDFIVRRKVQTLKNISSMSSLMKARKDLLKMKQTQTSTQLSDCVDMRLVCEHLMPSTCKDLDPKKLREMLNHVITLCSGANKKQVWNTVSNNLGHIEIPTLWLHVYQKLSEDVDNLMKLETEIIFDSKTSEENIDTGIAKVCGNHVQMVCKRIIYDNRANKHQQRVLEFIEQIEAASTNSTDISEWLALALEVRKLETEQKVLQNKIDKIQEDLQENNTLAFDLMHLQSEIENIDVEIECYVQDIQQSLVHLKSAPKLIVDMKEKMSDELEKIVAMRGNGYNSSWLKDYLTTELDIFYDFLNLNAIRKIMLKGDVGAYRHMKCCFSEASVSVSGSQSSNIMSYFPMVQMPVYTLIECYKNLSLMFLYKKIESLETEENSDAFQMPELTFENNDHNTAELLNLSKVVCNRAAADISYVNDILNAWTHQTVQKAMDVIEDTVDDVSFAEWTERYSLLLYMIENST